MVFAVICCLAFLVVCCASRFVGSLSLLLLGLWCYSIDGLCVPCCLVGFVLLWLVALWFLCCLWFGRFVLLVWVAGVFFCGFGLIRVYVFLFCCFWFWVY